MPGLAGVRRGDRHGRRGLQQLGRLLRRQSVPWWSVLHDDAVLVHRFGHEVHKVYGMRGQCPRLSRSLRQLRDGISRHHGRGNQRRIIDTLYGRGICTANYPCSDSSTYFTRQGMTPAMPRQARGLLPCRSIRWMCNSEFVAIRLQRTAVVHLLATLGLAPAAQRLCQARHSSSAVLR